MDTHTRNMELHEYKRTQHRRSKKRPTKIRVQMRSQMLLDAGFTQEQIIERALEVAKIQRQREETYASLRGSSPQLQGFGKLLSKNFKSGLNSLKEIGVGPKPSIRTTVSARSA